MTLHKEIDHFGFCAAVGGKKGRRTCSLRKKRYFTQKFAYVFEKYAKLSFRIPDPHPKHIPYAHMELALTIDAYRRKDYFTRA